MMAVPVIAMFVWNHKFKLQFAQATGKVFAVAKELVQVCLLGVLMKAQLGLKRCVFLRDIITVKTRLPLSSDY